MDKLSHVSRFIAAPSSLEQLPHEILQQVLHYLPVKTARNVFRLVNQDYLVGTDYLRVAGMVQTRIRSKIAGESQQQAESRFGILIDDCMNSAFSVALRSALVIELIGTLPQLPGVSHAAALRVVLAQCDTIGTHAGKLARQKCMAQCIHAYQLRTELEPQLEKFRPANDEEAHIAADHFVADLDPTMVPFEQIINHLEGLLGAMDWANDVDSLEKRGCLLGLMSDHCTSMFTLLNAAPDSLRKDPRWALVPQIGTKFARKALLLIPMQTISCQAALISVVLDLSLQEQTLIRHAELDAQQLIRTTPDALLLANWKSVANGLFRSGVIDLLIQRATAWPDHNCRLAMLKELAGIAWEKGAMGHMDRLCAMISKIKPPDLALLKKLMEKSAAGGVLERTEVVTRDIIPYLKCVAPGPAQSNMMALLNFEWVMRHVG